MSSRWSDEYLEKWTKGVDDALKELLTEKKERDGAIKLIKVLATIVAVGASAWAWIVSQILHVPK